MCNIIAEVCDVLWQRLVGIYMVMPKTTDDWKIIAKNFESRWNFPHCVGAIDGKHVVIKAPDNTGSLHFNYKGTFSIVLLALVDANYRFIYIDTGSYGRNSDGGIFAHSTLGKAMKANALNLPPDQVLPEAAELGPLPHVFVADEAFPLMCNVMRPYPGRKKDLDESQLIFNFRLSRARRIVENAFGILACRWRIYHTKIMVSPAVANNIIKATCVLHNFLQTTSTPAQITSIESEVSADCPPERFENLTRGGNRGSTEAADIRVKFQQYFATVGSIERQESYIRRGLFTE